MGKLITRRRLLQSGGLAGMAVLVGACQPKVVEKVVRETVPVKETVAVKETVTVKQTVVVEKGRMRELQGKITVAAEGVLPVPGAPLTRRQQAWRNLLAQYKQLQPKVQVVIEDLPQGQTGEVFCKARKAANTMPDLSMIGNCDYFRPRPEEIKDGTCIATDFEPFANETNPYTGRPWKEDWLNEAIRLTRGQENGAFGTWTCQTWWLELKQIFVNWDILKEYGVTSFPKSITELWELSKRILRDGKYATWDDRTYRWQNYNSHIGNMLTMDVYKAIGGNPDKPDMALLSSLPRRAELYCNQTLWISKWPSMQETIRQALRYIEAAGGGKLYFDPTRQPGKLWLNGRAAFLWDSTEFQPNINQAIEDGTFKVKNWTVEYFPNLTKNDLINKDLPISFGGKFWVEMGGQGDVFAPTPNVRGSGKDPNVDLIVRDFLQFLSSPMGQERVLDEGLLPVNPVAYKRASKVWQDAMDRVTAEADPYKGVTQPLAAYILWQVRRGDPQRNIEALARGEIGFDEAIKKADENCTISIVKQLQDQLKQWGLEKVPAPCAQWLGK